MVYKVLRPILHNGKYYAPDRAVPTITSRDFKTGSIVVPEYGGDTIDLSDAEAAQMTSGQIEAKAKAEEADQKAAKPRKAAE